MLHISLHVILLFISITLLVTGNELRIACPNPGNTGDYQCSADCTQLGFCDDSGTWVSYFTCPAGQLCINKGCTSTGTCPTQNWNLAVTCFDSALKMPNVEDPTCRTYYTCQTGTGSTGTGVLQTCPTGTLFDSCSGQCNASSCPAYASCPRGNAILESNEKLASVCTTTQIIWGTCPDGIYLDLTATGITCYSGINYRCTNGDSTNSGGSDSDSDSDSDEDGGLSCSAIGRFPIAGTDCGFLLCFSDMSYSVIACTTGYRYDQAAKACVQGTCTGTLPTSVDNEVNGWKQQMNINSEYE